jgi:hypothetical protein
VLFKPLAHRRRLEHREVDFGAGYAVVAGSIAFKMDMFPPSILQM